MKDAIIYSRYFFKEKKAASEFSLYLDLWLQCSGGQKV